MKGNRDPDGNWHFAHPLADVRDNGARVARIAGKQIALFAIDDGIRACDNRCPHEGYPLSEGSVSDDCWLTCNWHNWKFSLETGENRFGADRLRVYPTRVRDGEIWVDLTEAPFEERRDRVVASLRDAFDDHEYDRIARELARLIRLGADPLDALRLAIDWSSQRMEFGWTHAYAGMADWLALYHRNEGDRELQLVCLLESVSHAAFDVLREPQYPFPDGAATFDAQRFVQAVEDEDEPGAAALVRGGLRDGLAFTDLEHAFTRAALAHYNDFGHSLIYVTKVGYLIEQLGASVAEPLLLSLVRALVYARREDRIPEFRGYARALADWGKAHESAGRTTRANDWRGLGIDKALEATVRASAAAPEDIHRELLVANAVNLLSFDVARQDKVHVSVSGNVNWLDVTHGLTFANAVRKQCSRFPELWAEGLLQMACFAGRNAAYTTGEFDLQTWGSSDWDTTFAGLLDRVVNHGLAEYIVSVHWLKTALAVREEAARLAPAQTDILMAGLNRFINSPLPRRQVRRTAHQSLAFVDRE